MEQPEYLTEDIKKIAKDFGGEKELRRQFFNNQVNIENYTKYYHFLRTDKRMFEKTYPTTKAFLEKIERLYNN